jgi:hypothetical protein
MTHELDLNDFRARRSVLDPSDFALGGEQPDPPPADLIAESVWHEIMILPDDVAIRTTSHQGSRIQQLHTLWSSWVRAMPEHGILADAMLDVADDLNAAVFNLVHGYYRQAIAACRNALELAAFACECELYGTAHTWHDWQMGTQTLRFHESCRRIGAHDKVRALESIGQHTYGREVGLFPVEDERGASRKAWASSLYGRLGEFVHARGTNGQLWQSNGPVYSAKGLAASCFFFLETYAMLVLLAKLSREQFRVPDEAAFLCERETVERFLAEEFQGLCTYYGNTLLYQP